MIVIINYIAVSLKSDIVSKAVIVYFLWTVQLLINLDSLRQDFPLQGKQSNLRKIGQLGWANQMLEKTIGTAN